MSLLTAVPYESPLLRRGIRYTANTADTIPTTERAVLTTEKLSVATNENKSVRIKKPIGRLNAPISHLGSEILTGTK